MEINFKCKDAERELKAGRRIMRTIMMRARSTSRFYMQLPDTVLQSTGAFWVRLIIMWARVIFVNKNKNIQNIGVFVICVYLNKAEKNRYKYQLKNFLYFYLFIYFLSSSTKILFFSFI